MAKCANCGAKINERYTYCRDCFYKLGQPQNTVMNHTHKCRKCKRDIVGKYNYCMSCAKTLFKDNSRWSD